MYGFEVSDPHDPHIEFNEHTLESINEAFIPGRYLVDIFSFLEYIPGWIPGMSFKSKCIGWTKQVMTMRDMPFETARKSYVSICLVTAVI